MSSSTSSSSAAGGRSFVLVLALLVVGVEAAFATLARENRGRHEVDDAAHLVLATPAPIDTVFLSDSVSYGVLDDVELATGVLDLSSNQAIGVAGNYFLVQRLFERLKAEGAELPKHVVFALNPVSFDSNLDSKRFLQPYFTSVFRRPDEIADVEAALDRPDIVELMRTDARETSVALPSYLRRGLVHLPLRDGLRATKRWLQGSTGTANEAPGGAHLWRGAAAAQIETRSALPFTVSEVTAAYLPKLAALCAAHGATLLIIPAPVAPSLREAWDTSGFWRDLESWRELFQENNPGVRFLAESPFQPDQDAVFYDGVHLTQSAKNEWARILSELLAAPNEGTSPAGE